jgi:hypothetical protein
MVTYVHQPCNRNLSINVAGYFNLKYDEAANANKPGKINPITKKSRAE